MLESPGCGLATLLKRQLNYQMHQSIFTQFFSMLYSFTPWKPSDVDVFSGYKNVTLGRNGSSTFKEPTISGEQIPDQNQQQWL